MQSAGRARTIEQAIALAAKENPELYAQYRSAMDSEMATQQPTPRESSAPRAPIGKSDAYRALERMADGLMRTDPTLTREVAITKAASENPALYREYRAAQAAEAKAAQQEA